MIPTKVEVDVQGDCKITSGRGKGASGARLLFRTVSSAAAWSTHLCTSKPNRSRIYACGDEIVPRLSLLIRQQSREQKLVLDAAEVSD